jgi:hypothetical protein
MALPSFHNPHKIKRRLIPESAALQNVPETGIDHAAVPSPAPRTIASSRC